MVYTCCPSKTFSTSCAGPLWLNQYPELIYGSKLKMIQAQSWESLILYRITLGFCKCHLLKLQQHVAGNACRLTVRISKWGSLGRSFGCRSTGQQYSPQQWQIVQSALCIMMLQEQQAVSCCYILSTCS